MKLIIARHGQTDANVLKIMQGWTNSNLTPLGEEQAKKLALRLKDEKIDAIYTSDLTRTLHTAKEIAKYHPKSKFVVTEKLRELGRGEWEGKTRKEAGLENFPADKFWPIPKGGETHEQLKKRAKEIIDEAYAKHKNSTVLFVTHAATKNALAAIITGIKIESPLQLIQFKNTAVSIFEIFEDKSHKVHCLNCTKHLEQNT